MKKASLIVSMIAGFFVLLAVGILSYSVRKEKAAKTQPARDAKALRPELIEKAKELGLKYVGVSTVQLQQDIENFKPEDHGEIEIHERDTENIPPENS